MKLSDFVLLHARHAFDTICIEIVAKRKQGLLPKILGHLKPSKVTNYDQKLRNLTPGTTRWFFETKAFREWFNGNTLLLFISGGPGTGKSHLSTSAVDHRKSASFNTVGYYYFHEQEERSRSILNALCTIFYQMATDNEAHRVLAAEVCDLSPCYEMITLRNVWNDFIATENVLTPPVTKFLILDGIDEANRQDFVDLLETASVEGLEKLRVRLLPVGRPEMHHLIQSHFHQLPVNVINVTKERTQQDVLKFAQARYDKFVPNPSKYPALRREVTQSLASKADGNFLWIALMYKEVLRIKSPKQLSLVIENLLVRDLDDIYDRIFRCIQRESTRTRDPSSEKCSAG